MLSPKHPHLCTISVLSRNRANYWQEEVNPSPLGWNCHHLDFSIISQWSRMPEKRQKTSFSWPFFKAQLWPNMPKMSQILFLDPLEDISKLILKKKFFVENGFFWKILAFFWKIGLKTGQKMVGRRWKPLHLMWNFVSFPKIPDFWP